MGSRSAGSAEKQEQWQEVDRQVWEAKLREYIMKNTPRRVGSGKQLRKNEYYNRQHHNPDPGRRPDYDRYGWQFVACSE